MSEETHIIQFTQTNDGKVLLSCDSLPSGAIIRYEINYPRKKLFVTSGAYLAPIEAPSGSMILARVFLGKKGISDTQSFQIPINQSQPEQITPSTLIACTQNRDFQIYDWQSRHQSILDYHRQYEPDLILLGDSITHFWGGQPQDNPANPNGNVATDIWDDLFGSYRASNLGYGYDRIENALWRIEHGELDHTVSNPLIIIHIGTNNLSENSDDDIIQGMDHLLGIIKTKKPNARLIVHGILPREIDENHTTWERLTALNPQLEICARSHQSDFISFGEEFLTADKKINTTLISDGVHPNRKGYEIIAKHLKRLIGT